MNLNTYLYIFCLLTFGFLKFFPIKSLPKRISKTFSKFMIIIYYEHYESSFVYWQLALWVMAALIGLLPHDDNDAALRVSLQSRKLALWTHPPKKNRNPFSCPCWAARICTRLLASAQSAEPGTCDNNNAGKMQFNARLKRCVWRERVWQTLL